MKCPYGRLIGQDLTECGMYAQNKCVFEHKEAHDECVKIYKSCVKKMIYMTKEHADTYAMIHSDGQNMTSYKCSHCGWFHIGRSKD